MIKIIDFQFRIFVLITFGSIIMFGLIFCSLLLWDEYYINIAGEIQRKLFYGHKD